MNFVERFYDFAEEMGELKDYLKELKRDVINLRMENSSLRSRVEAKEHYIDYIGKNFLNLEVVDLMMALEIESLQEKDKDDIRELLQGKDPYKKRAGD